MGVVLKSATLLAGEDHVDVAHDCAPVPPSVDAIYVCPKDNIGCNYWKGNVGDTTFTIYVDNVDPWEDRHFSCIIITSAEGFLPVTDEGRYSSLDYVKIVLGITETSYDAELYACIDSADGLMKSRCVTLNVEEPSTSSVPRNVTDASAHFAAYLYRQRRDPVGAKAFLDEAELFLKTYLDSETVPEVSGKRG